MEEIQEEECTLIEKNKKGKIKEKEKVILRIIRRRRERMKKE